MLFRWLFPQLGGSQQQHHRQLAGGVQALGSFEEPLCLPGAFPQGSLETPEPDACVRRDFGLDFGWKAESDSY